MKKFELPPHTTSARAAEMIVERINELMERLERLEDAPVMPHLEYCNCNSSYTGVHGKNCLMYGHRVRSKYE